MQRPSSRASERLRKPVNRVDLQTVIVDLAAHHPLRPPLTDPFAIIVWESVGYLIDDERREALFGELRDRIGLSAACLAPAPQDVVLDIARRGGSETSPVWSWKIAAAISPERCASFHSPRRSPGVERPEGGGAPGPLPGKALLHCDLQGRRRSPCSTRPQSRLAHAGLYGPA